MLKRFSHEMRMNKHVKKLVHFKTKNAYKTFEKNKFEYKNWRDSSLGNKKLTLRSKNFLPVDLIFIHGFKISQIHSRRTKYSPCVSKLVKIVEVISQPTEDAKSCGFFLIKRTWAGEWFKILTNLKIFVHLVQWAHKV